MITHKKILLLSLGFLSAISLAVKAEAAPKHIVVAPQCLIEKTSVNFRTLAKLDSLVLIEANQKEFESLLAAKNMPQTTPCGGFMDVSVAWKDYQKQTFTGKNTPTNFLAGYVDHPKKQTLKASEEKEYKIQYSDQVNQLLKQVNPQEMWGFLTTLTNYKNRNANTQLGVDTANWIQSEVENMAKASNRTDVTVYQVASRSAAGEEALDIPQYKQPSVVAKLGEGSGPGIVIGGHMDTIVMFNDKQPGADDDGSGSSTVLEIAKTIISSGMKFKKPIYFMWYAAEEYGLYGSQYVVAKFKKDNIPVESVIHFDMTGYNKNDPKTLWLIKDNTDAKLTDYLKTLIETYVKQPVGFTTCGYACSDHATWNKNGFTAAFPFEAQFGKEDPYIHSTNDKMEHLSLDHMTDFAKLGIAFAVEQAEPVV